MGYEVVTAPGLWLQKWELRRLKRLGMYTVLGELVRECIPTTVSPNA